MDLKLNRAELRNLMNRLDRMPGFDFYPDRFLKEIGESKTFFLVGDVMAVIRNLLDDNLSEESNIFVLKPIRLLSSTVGLSSKANSNSTTTQE